MVTLLDTDRLPPSERRPAQVAARLEASMASRVRFAGRRPPGHARLDAWDPGGVSVVRADLAGELVLSRSARQTREDAEPMVSFAVQELGVALQDHLGSRRVVPCGGLTLTEVASAYEYRWSGRGVCRSLQLPVSRLGLPVDVVRRAVPLARSSPLYGLVRAHVEQVTGAAGQLADEPLVRSLASATIDLTRALLASATGPGRATDDAVAETMLSQVRGYVRQHLTEPGLDAGQVAAGLAISVRQLYRLCSSARFSLEQWIIQQRLEGARAEQADPGSRGRPIAVVARRWGFTDASYFSRRFLQAFGVTPRDWRQAGPSGPATLLPAPRRRAAALPDTARLPPAGHAEACTGLVCSVGAHDTGPIRRTGVRAACDALPVAGGMHRGRHGPSLADRAVSSGVPGPGGRPGPTRHDGPRRPAGEGHGRHCWVRDPPDAPGIWPGLLVEWRQRTDGWQGRVAYTVVGEHGPVLVEAWLPAEQLKQG
jgi:AraC-like DNA-binding protein